MCFFKLTLVRDVSFIAKRVNKRIRGDHQDPKAARRALKPGTETSVWSEVVDTDRAFFVWQDDDASSFTVINGKILQFTAENLMGSDSLDLDDVGMCTLNTCSSAEVKAIVVGERAKDNADNEGDLLVLDFGWEESDDFHIQCPEQFQVPTAQLLACKSDDVDDCAFVADGDCQEDDYSSNPNDNALPGGCFGSFAFENDDTDSNNPRNTLVLDHHYPNSDHVVIRFAVFCPDPDDVSFDSLDFKVVGGTKNSKKSRRE